jgi:hypothetical protein
MSENLCTRATHIYSKKIDFYCIWYVSYLNLFCPPHKIREANRSGQEKHDWMATKMLLREKII